MGTTPTVSSVIAVAASIALVSGLGVQAQASEDSITEDTRQAVEATAERTGEAAAEAAEEIEDTTEEAVDEAQDAAEEAGDEIEPATD
jgi:hypothetical protein